MAKTLETFTLKSGRSEQRDWSKLFDGKVHELKRGEDFEIALDSFRGTAGSAARRHGGKLESRADQKAGVLQIRFVKNGSKPNAAKK